jgi:thiol-disulfide isomerase/thioredoxin
MKLIYTITVLFFIGFTSCKESSSNKSKQVAPALSESEIEKIKLIDLQNNPIDLKQYKGKTVFINFWATWCKPCLQEMPSIQKAQEMMKNDNIVFLFASDESMEQIEKFKNNKPYNFNYVRVENIETLNIMALPTTYIFNKEGKLVFSEMGFKKWDDQENIDLLLNIGK